MQLSVGTLLMAMIGATAAPQTSTRDGAPSHVDRIAACLEIADNTRRLECFDAAGRALVDATRRREIVMVDKDEVKSTRRSLFGFQLPRIGLFGKGGPDKGDEIDTIEAKITNVSTLGYGKYGFTIEGGARWATTEAWVGSLPPVAGQVMTIRKAALGSYFVKIGKGKGIRAMRTG
ncbi:hypothetical protein M9980_06995 [Sphingomonas donggukensis]|uniref:Uncharacterized protein n=1 Tax=Sphingomonas donggukensis TaxID=2949093 RepID=A0ABY4U300_9SPHN|nr:hypothetical protein [Sphingomonas donggukensis]URW76933.1 hypothetical protein M9980_06995 [Sphingomonas donggukensis]